MNKHVHQTDADPTGCTNHWRRPRRLGITAGLALLTSAAMLPTVSLSTAVAHPAKNSRAAISSSEARCAAALWSVQASGLVLPTGFEYRCPGDTRSFVDDRQRWGVTCYHHPTFCAGGAYVAVNPARVGRSDTRLRYVVAHEIGHAIDYVTQGSTTEQSAHARARAAGF